MIMVDVCTVTERAVSGPSSAVKGVENSCSSAAVESVPQRTSVPPQQDITAEPTPPYPLSSHRSQIHSHKKKSHAERTTRKVLPIHNDGDSVLESRGGDPEELAHTVPPCSVSETSEMEGATPKKSLKRRVPTLGIERTQQKERDPPSPSAKRQRVVADPISTGGPVLIAPKPQPTLLLARSKDGVVLSPLHTFVRQQIEVFAATEQDINQPAPGRKNPVSLHQVGLRCIHCRDLPLKQKVKRAVCYPSTVGRVYHSVSDMKFDHFSHCKSLPPDVREQFNQLKDERKRKVEKKSSPKVTGCSSSTAQYYHDAACEMGMVDGNGGVFWKDYPPTAYTTCASTAAASPQPTATEESDNMEMSSSGQDHQSQTNLLSQLETCRHLNLPSQMSSALLFQQEFFQRTLGQQYLISLLAKSDWSGGETSILPRPEDPKPVEEQVATIPRKKPGWTLSCPIDDQYLNPIHCFVRRHVEFFSADEDDVNAPSPGRKVRVVKGQVGIRCIHCVQLPMKDRVKRSVCYPPSIAGVYHAVSNMKFDHFAKCKGLPAADREEFIGLRSTGLRKSSKTNLKVAPDRGFANSTAQYYHDSSLRMGLVDTQDGIRFGTKFLDSGATRSGSPQSASSSSPSDGISALMIAAASDLNVAGSATGVVGRAKKTGEDTDTSSAQDTAEDDAQEIMPV